MSADPSQTATEAAGRVPDDADDTRGLHLRRLLLRPLTLAAVALAAIGLVVGATAAGITIGALVALGVILAAFVVVWLIANCRAARDFSADYAEGRGLSRVEARSSLPSLTPLLSKGNRRYAEQPFRRRPARRPRREPLPVHLRGGVQGLRRRPPDDLRSLHDRDQRATGEQGDAG